MDWKERDEGKAQYHSCAVRVDGDFFHVLLGDAGGRANCVSQAASGTTHRGTPWAQHHKTSKGSCFI